MKLYMVGGAVRDKLLGKEPADIDFVAVGATKEEMLSRGYTPVGKSFQVYLAPESGEEVSLADNSLEEELGRRDLTINAIAIDPQSGELIDPYKGAKDLKNRVLKHTSERFADDPLRILRLARFACQLTNFSIHSDTIAFIRSILRPDLFASIPGERVFREINKAMSTDEPWRFFALLKEWGALKFFFPELDRLEGVEQKKEYHPEGDVWTHTLLCLKAACAMEGNNSVKFAVLVHDLGKALTPKRDLPGHPQHEKRGLQPVNKVCDRFKADAYTKKLALKVCELHLKAHRVKELRPGTLLDLIIVLNGHRDENFIKDFVLCCKADKLGRDHEVPMKEYEQGDLLLKAAGLIRNLKPDSRKIQTASKPEEFLRQLRIKALKSFL